LIFKTQWSVNWAIRSHTTKTLNFKHQIEISHSLGAYSNHSNFLKSLKTLSKFQRQQMRKNGGGEEEE